MSYIAVGATGVEIPPGARGTLESAIQQLKTFPAASFVVKGTLWNLPNITKPQTVTHNMNVVVWPDKAIADLKAAWVALAASVGEATPATGGSWIETTRIGEVIKRLEGLLAKLPAPVAKKGFPWLLLTAGAGALMFFGKKR